VNFTEELKKKPYLIGLAILTGIFLAWTLFNASGTQVADTGQWAFGPSGTALVVFGDVLVKSITSIAKIGGVKMAPFIIIGLAMFFLAPGLILGLLGLIIGLVVALIALFTGNFTLFLIVLGFGFALMILGGRRK
jgi:hypothetical protein